MGSGQAKAGDEGTVGQSRQEVLLLFGCPVSDEQFTRSKRVRDGDGCVGVGRVRSEFCENVGYSLCGESLAAPFLGYFESKEFFVTHVIPCFSGKVLGGDNFVVVDEGTQLTDLLV